MNVPHVAMTTAGTPAPKISVETCFLSSVRVQADRSAGRLTGSMMELQTLQEALKVEIQIHQVRCVSRPLGQWVRRWGVSNDCTKSLNFDEWTSLRKLNIYKLYARVGAFNRLVKKPRTFLVRTVKLILSKCELGLLKEFKTP